jgi:hypothetical protein
MIIKTYKLILVHNKLMKPLINKFKIYKMKIIKQNNKNLLSSTAKIIINNYHIAYVHQQNQNSQWSVA